MNIHRFRLPTPDAACILEIPDQFLLLGINADRELSRLLMRLTLVPNIRELLVSVGMWGPFVFFDIQSQVIPGVLQQAADYRATHAMSDLGQTLPHVVQPTVEPFGPPHRVARRVRFNHFQEGGH
jgi:hypothetical protein